jgi:serine O-acetyltransferase
MFPIRIIYRHQCHGFGCYMPFSVQLGQRVGFRHQFYGVFISNGAVIGDDCIILHHITIGSNRDVTSQTGSPVLESGVFVGVGAKIIGEVHIGPGARIGANAIVVDDVPAGATAVSPKARIIMPKAAETSAPESVSPPAATK